MEKTGLLRVKEIFDSRGVGVKAVRDSAIAPDPISFSSSELLDIRDSLWEQVTDNVGEGNFTNAIALDQQVTKMVKDSFYNSITGVDTTADPGYYNTASIPVMLSPTEASALYSSGGLHQVIVDKKTKGIFMNGYRFEGTGWEEGELAELHSYAESLNFQQYSQEAVRDSLIFGGSGLIPAFKGDTTFTYSMYLPELLEEFRGKREFVSHFWTADRWNLVLIPDVIISHKDYLYPDFFQVPLAGLNVNTDRIAVLRFNKLPFWAALQQIGWGRSDLEGYTRSVKAYEMMMLSLPIMAQQISLLYHHVPLDGIIAQDGPAAAEQWTQANNKQLTQWSMLNPKSINSFGEIKVVDRNYTGFDNLVMLARQDIGAKSGVHESSLFDTQSKGFSGAGDDIVLKQSEYLSGLGLELAPQFANVVKILALSLFGTESEQAKRIGSLKLVFDSPVVVTNQQKATSGNQFATMIQSLVGSGVKLSTATDLARLFIKDVEVPIELLDAIKESEKEAEKVERSEREAEKTAVNPGSENFLRKAARNVIGKGKG